MDALRTFWGLLRCGRSVCVRVWLCYLHVRPARELGGIKFMRLRLGGIGRKGVGGGRQNRCIMTTDRVRSQHGDCVRKHRTFKRQIH